MISHDLLTNACAIATLIDLLNKQTSAAAYDGRPTSADRNPEVPEISLQQLG